MCQVSFTVYNIVAADHTVATFCNFNNGDNNNNK